MFAIKNWLQAEIIPRIRASDKIQEKKSSFFDIWMHIMNWNEINEEVKPNGLFDLLVSGSFRIEIRRLAFVAALEGQVILAFADKLDPVLAYSDSIGSKVLSKHECVAYWRSALIPFQRNYGDPRIMDSDIVRWKHW